jgi:8-oxo-dGTP pyrophosphatase MutT (NUDIX family)
MAYINNPLTIKKTEEVALQKPEEVKHLKLIVVDYIDRFDQPRRWEFVSRKGDKNTVPNVVTVIAYNIVGDLLLIKQPRASFNKFIMSFPAGLIDPTDKDPYDTAKRELGQETGYTIKQYLGYTPFMAISPGLSNEAVSVVEVIVNDLTIHPVPKLEKGEDIQCFWVNPEKLRDKIFLLNLLPENTLLDAQVWYYATGLIKPKNARFLPRY